MDLMNKQRKNLKKMSDKQFRAEVVKIIENVKDNKNEFGQLASSTHYFKSRYPEISKQFKDEISKLDDHKTWSGFFREIRFWNELGVPQMYRRTMLLSMRLASKTDEFFKIDSDIGSYTLPTKLGKFLKMALVAKDFVYDIYPRIENNINFKSESIIETSDTIRGTINWTRTITNSVKRGDKHPTQFACIINQNDFETPENILTILCLLKIQTDLETLLFETSELDYARNELRMIFELKTRIDFLISHSHMKFLISKFDKYKFLNLDSKIIKFYENETKNRIQKDTIKQKSYLDLTEWLKKYRGYNMEGIIQKYLEFPIKHERSLDTMYELWIFFEMSNYFKEQKNVKVLSSLKNTKNNFAGFELEIENKKVNLRYQYEEVGWTEIKSNPDIVLEIDGKIPIIMDPKNYTREQSVAINKMLAYLLNLGKSGATIGILFFPYGIERTKINETDYKSVVNTTDSVFGRTLSLSTIVLNPTKPQEVRKNMGVVFGYVYETILSEIKSK